MISFFLYFFTSATLFLHFFHTSSTLLLHFSALLLHFFWNRITTMASRSELMQRLAVLPTYELLRLLTDDTILEIASRCFTVGAQASIMTPPLTANEPETPPVDKAKRPLNAFMAFRSKNSLYCE